MVQLTNKQQQQYLWKIVAQNILSARVDERSKPCWWSISSFKIKTYMGPHNADVKTEIWKCPHKHNGYLSPQGRIEIFKDVMCPDKRSRGVLWNAHILIFLRDGGWVFPECRHTYMVLVSEHCYVWMYVRTYVCMYVCNMAFITNHKPNTVCCMNKQLTQV